MQLRPLGFAPRTAPENGGGDPESDEGFAKDE